MVQPQREHCVRSLPGIRDRTIRDSVRRVGTRLEAAAEACEFDWGRGTFLNTKAGITCVSDSLIGKDAVGTESTWWNGQPGAQVMTLPGRKAVTLAYGASMTFGPLTCSSQLDGMHCTNSTTKAGFDISRTEYTLR